jgi:hypothetical protein
MAAHAKTRIPHRLSLQRGDHNGRTVGNKPADVNRLGAVPGKPNVAEVRVRTSIFVVRDIGASALRRKLAAPIARVTWGLARAAAAAQRASASSCRQRRLGAPCASRRMQVSFRPA